MNKILSLLRELTNDEFHHKGDKGNIITLEGSRNNFPFYKIGLTV